MNLIISGILILTGDLIALFIRTNSSGALASLLNTAGLVLLLSHLGKQFEHHRKGLRWAQVLTVAAFLLSLAVFVQRIT